MTLTLTCAHWQQSPSNTPADLIMISYPPMGSQNCSASARSAEAYRSILLGVMPYSPSLQISEKNRIPREQSSAGWNLQYRQTNTLRKDGTQLSYLRCQPSQRRRACRMELIICEWNSLKINKINVLTTISPSGYFSTYLISWLHYRTECATVTCCCRTGRQNPCCIT